MLLRLEATVEFCLGEKALVNLRISFEFRNSRFFCSSAYGYSYLAVVTPGR
jgi:hypothetical protein